MLKTLTRLTLAALAAVACATPCAAQDAHARPPAPAAQSPNAEADAWVTVAPDGDRFAVLMPTQPAAAGVRLTAGGMYVGGARYTAATADGRTSYFVWSLQNPGGVLWERLRGTDTTADGVRPESLYLDHVAEVVWELLVAPEQARLKRESESTGRPREHYVDISYARDFELNGRPAREYFIALEKARGPVYVCADGEHIYVAAALGPYEADRRLKRFVDSFSVGTQNPSLPASATIEVDPLLVKPDPRDDAGSRPPGIARADRSHANAAPRGNTGGGDAPAANPDGPLRHTEVTRKAIIVFKPEPGFTDEARRFNVTGVVRLRGVLSAEGKVMALSVVKPLPHGLTRKALVAARSIRFQPAQKDGRPVSQYVVLEYNFNIY